MMDVDEMFSPEMDGSGPEEALRKTRQRNQ
jgi:hypothetical protein